MTRTHPLLPALLLALCANAALAQSPASAPPPPKLEKIEEIGDDAITVTSKPQPQQQITEKREGGRVTEVTVKSGPSTYKVKPNTPAGSALPGDVMGSANKGPMWTVMEFDIGKKKKKSEEEEAAAAQPADVPPPPQPPKQ
jgi:hypothetical protein